MHSFEPPLVTKDTWPPESARERGLAPQPLREIPARNRAGTGSAELKPCVVAPFLRLGSSRFWPEKRFCYRCYRCRRAECCSGRGLAPITSPFCVTPGCRLNNCTTLRVWQRERFDLFLFGTRCRHWHHCVDWATSAITLTEDALVARSSRHPPGTACRQSLISSIWRVAEARRLDKQRVGARTDLQKLKLTGARRHGRARNPALLSGKGDLAVAYHGFFADHVTVPAVRTPLGPSRLVVTAQKHGECRYDFQDDDSSS